MVRTLAGLSALAVAMSVAMPASAQTRETGNVAVGYGYLRDSDFSLPRGWVFAGAGNISPDVAIVGEVGGNYKSVGIENLKLHLSEHSFLGGVRFQGAASPAVTPFVQVLVGTVLFSGSGGGDSDSMFVFGFQPGGGVDIKLSPKVRLRTQADYRASRSNGDTLNQFRFAVGAVFALHK